MAGNTFLHPVTEYMPPLTLHDMCKTVDLAKLPEGIIEEQLAREKFVLVTLFTMESVDSDGSPVLSNQLVAGMPMDVQVSKTTSHSSKIAL